MCSPSGVCDARVRVENLGKVWLLVRDQLLQLGNLANFLESKDFILLVTVNS
jgi:hypothetical protein